MKLSKYIDHTLLKPNATIEQIHQLCKEAIENDFASVCINPDFIQVAVNDLKNSNVSVCTVIGFPLGANTIETKVFETNDAISKGADEIDMVINISKLKEGNLAYVTNEIAQVKHACKDHILKVIVETCLLNEQEKINACKCVSNAKADFIKTSTGFSTSGAMIEDIKLFRKNLPNSIKIKASGGIKTKEVFEAMIEAGANRIGTSNGTKLIK